MQKLMRSPIDSGSSMDVAYDAPWQQQMASNVIFTTKAEPMSYNASTVLK